MLESYMDESGIHDGAQICVVGGYYGTHVEWRKLEKSWRRVLRKYSLEDHGFHAKEFWGRKDGKRISVYETWDDAKAIAFIDELIQQIMRHRIFPFGHGIVVADWNAVPLEFRKWFTGAEWNMGKFFSSGSPNKSYYLPFQFCIRDATKHAGNCEKVHFFAGLDRTLSDYATVLYKQILRDTNMPRKHLLGNLDYPLSKDTPPIQAADLLVYQLYQFSKARFKGPVKMRPILKRLIVNRHADQHMELFRTPELRKLVDMALEKQKALAG